MGTEVLRPQDCLGERFRLSPVGFQRRKGVYGRHTAAYKKPVVARSEKKVVSRRSPSSDDLRSRHSSHSHASNSSCSSNNGLVMGHVTILRRGESLDSLNSKLKNNNAADNNNSGSNNNKKAKPPKQRPVDDLAVCGTGRLGPDMPEMVPKQIRLSATPANRAAVDVYAGSAFSMSPSPRSLPLPTFFSNVKKPYEDGHAQIFDDSATRDLRRLLRLE